MCHGVGVAGIGIFWQPSDGTIGWKKPEKAVRRSHPESAVGGPVPLITAEISLNDSIRLFRRPVESAVVFRRPQPSWRTARVIGRLPARSGHPPTQDRKAALGYIAALPLRRLWGMTPGEWADGTLFQRVAA